MSRAKSTPARESRRPGSAPRAPLVSPARRREAAGALLVALAVVTGLSLFSQGGTFTEPWKALLRDVFGWGAVASPLVLGACGAWLVLDSMDGSPTTRWERPLAGLGVFVALLGLVHLAAARTPDAARALADADGGGGLVGYAVGQALSSNLGRLPAAVVLFVAVALGASVAAGRTLGETAGLAGRSAKGGARGLWALGPRLRRPRRVRPAVVAAVAAPAGSSPVTAPSPAVPTPAARHGAGPAWRLPAVDEVLEPAPEVVPDRDDGSAMAATIERTLGEFGIPVKVIEVNRGPTITQFGLEPGYVERNGRRSRVKVSRITALQNDLALALAASPIRIQAPVPGRPYVGVEVPNAATALVSLRSVIESDAFRAVQAKGSLPIALGRDTSGRSVAADLAAMPHLLIAGATGSGKSVAINALISTLLVTHTPDTLKLLLIDPKRVELAPFRGLPHLGAPVVVDIERVVGVLQWAVREMDRRYREFAAVGARNIGVYNQQRVAAGAEILPFLVIVIDELADLMMVAPEEAERLITRLAQLARATGIHLVIATQRPSVDVVTGLIKANFPSRIAFAVSSGVDSRVILDTSGAEKLLGRGDMLYQASDASKMARLQGCYVSDAEIERLTRFWKYTARPMAPLADTSLTLGLPEPLIQPELWEALGAPPAAGDRESRDELWAEAVELIRQHNTASTSFLQRKLRIGYSRAARLLDQLEAAALIGPAQGNHPRDVLTTGEDAPEAAEAPHGPADDDDAIRPWLA